MKKVILLILCIAMITTAFTGCGNNTVTKPSEQASADSTNITTAVKTGSTAITDRNNQFAFNIFSQLDKEDKNKNVFISPLSISTVLTMAYQGAGSSTRVAMAKALGYQGINTGDVNNYYQKLFKQLKQTNKTVELNINNSIWLRDGIKVKDYFLTVNKDIFGADVKRLDFSKKEAPDKINGWISDSTKGKIKKMIDDKISDDVIMYLINAIYFKGDWEEQFLSNNSADAEFHNGNGGLSIVSMMRKNGKIEYGAVDGEKIVRLPYKGGKVAMYCILPREGTSINDYISKLNLEKWAALRKSISETEHVILQLPKFKIEYGIKDLNKSLSELGMAEAFSDKADFSGIGDNTRISRVAHKAVIEVNEKGSEAAAATAVVCEATSAMAEPPKFIADRPFIFIIEDDESGTILFMGKLFNNP